MKSRVKPLAIMASVYRKTPSPTKDKEILQKKGLTSSLSQQQDLTLEQKQKIEILQKLEKKKNIFGPIKNSNVVIPSYNKRKQIILKPELDTGLTTDRKERLKTLSLRKKKQSLSPSRGNIKSRNNHAGMLALAAPHQSNSIEVGETQLAI